MRKHGQRARERQTLVHRTIMLSMRDAQYQRLGIVVSSTRPDVDLVYGAPRRRTS